MKWFPWLLCLLLPTALFAQPISHQNWQAATLSSDTLSVLCAELFLPFEVGRLLVENAPSSRGELDSSLRSSQPVKVLLQPEGGATSDTLTSITGCTLDGAVVQLAMQDSGDTITIPHTGGSIEFVDGLSVVLDNQLKILTLQRVNGRWIADSGFGGGGSGGGNIILQSGQRIDLTGLGTVDANEGIILQPGTTSCFSAITDGQLCLDWDDEILYFGKSGGIIPITGGSGGGGCNSLETCAAGGKTIGGLDGESEAFIMYGSSNTACKFYEGAQAFTIKCVSDLGGTEVELAPTELKTISLLPSAFQPDGTLFVRNFEVTLGSEIVPVTLTPAASDTAEIKVFIPIMDRWDGVTLTVTSFLHTAEGTIDAPAGNILLDWSGYCVDHGSANGTAGYAAEVTDGEMLIQLDGHAQNDLIITATTGNVPVTGCTGSGSKSLWLRAQVDATATTANDQGVDPLLAEQHFTGFMLKYGSKTYTD